MAALPLLAIPAILEAIGDALVVLGVVGAGVGGGAILADQIKKAREHAADRAVDAAPATTCRSCPAASTGGPPPDDDIPCFKKPANASAAEFDRQIAEQEAAINKLSPQDLLRQRQLVKQIGTKTLRNQEAQELARDAFAQARKSEIFKRLRAQGTQVAEAAKSAGQQVAAELKTLDATHRLDIIAGGDPSDISGMGGSDVNRSIGRQWRDRVEALDKNATDALKRGESRMNVRLKRCK